MLHVSVPMRRRMGEHQTAPEGCQVFVRQMMKLFVIIVFVSGDKGD